MPAVIRILFLLLISFAGLAEPLHPLRSKAGIDSLRRQLWHTPPGTARARLLIQLSSSLVDRHEEFSNPLDSAQAYCIQAAALSRSFRAPSEEIRSQYVLGRLLQYLPQPADGKPLLQQAISKSRRLGDARQEAEGWYYLGDAYTLSAAEIPQRLRCFAQSMALYQTLGDKQQATLVLKTIADMHHLQGNNAQAREELLRVVAFYRASGYRRLQYTYDLLLDVNRKLGNYKEALQYGFVGVESAQATKDTAMLVILYGRVATVYSIIDQPAEALANYKLSLRYAHHLKKKSRILPAARYIALLLIKQHQPQQALAFFLSEARNYPPISYLEHFNVAMALTACYSATKEYGLAEKYESQALYLMESGKVHEENEAQKFATYITISEQCVGRQQYAKARRHIIQAQALQLQAGSLSAAATIEWLLFKVDSAQSHFLAAIGHHQRYKALNDSIFNEAKNKQLLSLEIQYDTHKKEHSIALLTKQTQVQQAQLREHELQRKTVVVGAVLLTLLLGMGYNRYLLKQRNSQLLEVKQAEITDKNASLELVLGEKEGLLHDKDTLLDEKEGLLRDKDTLLEEKEWLLKEVHHRVKNNLQLIISLLQSQRKYLLDDAAVHAIEQSQHRVRAMALIHQKLYRSEDLSHIDMPDYIQEVVEHLSESFDPDEQVTFHFRLAPLALDVAQAVPLGLIVNEAITNALKYAFPPGSRPMGHGGTVEVSLTHEAGDRYLLVVADDGVGLPTDVDLRRSNSMGANIMRGLSKQLGGTLHVDSHQGVTVSVSFTFSTLSFPHASAS
jgi:two-component sensor histidine kinase/tetratricopeptide (TPR) repeat protein